MRGVGTGYVSSVVKAVERGVRRVLSLSTTQGYLRREGMGGGGVRKGDEMIKERVDRGESGYGGMKAHQTDFAMLPTEHEDIHCLHIPFHHPHPLHRF